MTKDFSLHTPKLSPRLKMVAEMVPSCERVIDIGADHAFVPIYLIVRERCSSAIASDIHKGPAMTAQRNIDQYQMKDRISVIIGDGLNAIQTTPQDSIVIAGMGGCEIRFILSNGPFLAKALILQPQKSYKELRTFLAKEGYTIKNEEIAKEQNRYYLGMSIEYSGIPYELTALELEIGPCILKEKPRHFDGFLEQRMEKIKKQVLGDPSAQEVLNQLDSWKGQNGSE